MDGYHHGRLTMAFNAQVSVSISSSGDTIVIPGISGQAISVISMILSLETETTVQFKSGSTALSGAQPMLAITLDEQARGPWYVTANSEAFVISLGSSVACGGTVWYRQGAQ